MTPVISICRNISALIFVLFFAGLAAAQTTAFTYQGRLTDTTVPASGAYEFQFRLFDTASAGNQIGNTLTLNNIQVINGIFTVTLDFGSTAFPASGSRFLEVQVKKPADPGFTILDPRQQILNAPYSIRTISANSADELSNSCVQCVDDAKINTVSGNKVTGTVANATSAANVTGIVAIANGGTGSSTKNFVDLTTNQTVGGIKTFSSPVNTNFHYNISGITILSAPGTDNLFIGADAGKVNLTGTGNAFVGKNAGAKNTIGSGNTFFGVNAGANTTTGIENSFFGVNTGIFNDSGNFNAFIGRGAGSFNSTGSFNVFIGVESGSANSSGNNNTAIGAGSNFGANNLTFATAIGSEAVVSTSNTIVLGRANGSDKVRIFGLGTAGATTLCRNANNEISSCSSSLRYKTNINSFSSGMSFIKQLRPITFDWKQDGIKDVGFGAEDIAQINPLFVNFNSKGEVEGIKYDRLSVVFANAFREQQTQIEQQQKQIEEQKILIDALKELVCANNPNAAVCK